MSHPDIFKKYENVRAIGDAMCNALVGYAYQDPEFRFKKGTPPLKYWKRLRKDPDVEVLAVRDLTVWPTRTNMELASFFTDHRHQTSLSCTEFHG